MRSESGYAGRLVIETTHENRESVDQEYDDPKCQISGTHAYASNRKRPAGVVSRIVFDLRQRDRAQYDRGRRGKQTDAAAPTNTDAEYSQDQRRNRQTLLLGGELSHRQWGRRRWLPPGRQWRRRRVTAGQIKRRLPLRIGRCRGRDLDGRWRLLRARGDQRGPVFSAVAEPLFVECAIAGWAAFHNSRGSASHLSHSSYRSHASDGTNGPRSFLIQFPDG